ncbi:hypothetical protein B0H11DRAFT_1901305 [Mycena galericulata]|nr:hypothetical protein B0H11DRAFT_1901305 [Mycena galericulata]
MELLGKGRGLKDVSKWHQGSLHCSLPPRFSSGVGFSEQRANKVETERLTVTANQTGTARAAPDGPVAIAAAAAAPPAAERARKGDHIDVRAEGGGHAAEAGDVGVVARAWRIREVVRLIIGEGDTGAAAVPPGVVVVVQRHWQGVWGVVTSARWLQLGEQAFFSPSSFPQSAGQGELPDVDTSLFEAGFLNSFGGSASGSHVNGAVSPFDAPTSEQTVLHSPQPVHAASPLGVEFAEHQAQGYEQQGMFDAGESGFDVELFLHQRNRSEMAAEALEAAGVSIDVNCGAERRSTQKRNGATIRYPDGLIWGCGGE